LHEVLHNCGPLGEKFQVRFELAEDRGDIDFDTDRIRFTQVMNNLLSNAAKYSPAGGVVEIAYGLKDDRVEVTVTDRGSGIPSEYQDRIFDKFFQMEGTAKQSRSGTGLGLSISRHLIQQMDGSITVDSVPGRTVFSVLLPRWQAD
jgi:signal transduction histidine kinase